MTAKTAKLRDYLEQQIAWQRGSDPDFPYQTMFGDQSCLVRLNDFPNDELYTLIVEGDEVVSFSDWPESWVKPTTNSGSGLFSQRALMETLIDQLLAGRILLDEAVAEFEKLYIQKALARNQNNLSKTAKLLGIERRTLSKTISDYKRSNFAEPGRRRRA